MSKIYPNFPKNRKEAHNSHFNRYDTGKPCKNGHLSDRYKTGQCVKCQGGISFVEYSEQTQMALDDTIHFNPNIHPRSPKEYPGPSVSDNYTFKLRVKWTHGIGRYHINGDYVSAKTEIEFCCREGHIYRQLPNNILNGQDCPVCAESKRNISRFSTTHEFIHKATETHNGIYDYSLVDYENSVSKIKIICPTHGIFIQSPSSHLCGRGCPVCGDERGKEIRAREYGYWALEKNRIKDIPYTLYHVQITIGDTTFEKVGITARSVADRFKPLNSKSAKVKTIECFIGDFHTCFDIEAKIMLYLDSIKERYKIRVLKDTHCGGWTECFRPNLIALSDWL